ncbi:hypothetical protein [Novipirellula artificiosorum]|uniref:Uncharacterized protein n=1 Tax=Novipirellula artificiosorum TaxID=2528016 RepID=A0A5C6D4Z9_9BACT|nr:hypothetical protein [Novipirellula artificiosorum]TWU32012.1 hypothetical protein Poly41_59000 [Novipirellula artificiosorum]
MATQILNNVLTLRKVMDNCKARPSRSTALTGVRIISYARARLWIGVSGVGLIVTACVLAILEGLPGRFLPTSRFGSVSDLGWILVLIGSTVAFMAPLDFLGGYFIPSRFYHQKISLDCFLRSWTRGVAVQAILFFLSTLVILTVGRNAGLIGALISIAIMSVAYVGFQSRLVLAMTGCCWTVDDDKVIRAMNLASGWGLEKLPVTVVQSSDPGFTGGVVGLPRFESIMVPKDFVDLLTLEQLALVLARRLVAVDSGSRTRGISLALIWIVCGFSLATLLPGASVASVSGLATTCLGFTIWTFLGLLTLPTVSRQASYAIDGEILRRSAETKAFTETIRSLDAFQDDEPSRRTLIETIFHPVPSVDNRQRGSKHRFPFAWHTARTTLFLSWSCMGLLARAVHCNVGRPERWVMLPTD